MLLRSASVALDPEEMGTRSSTVKGVAIIGPLPWLDVVST